jgi:hypothetical protein
MPLNDLTHCQHACYWYLFNSVLYNLGIFKYVDKIGGFELENKHYLVNGKIKKQY